MAKPKRRPLPLHIRLAIFYATAALILAAGVLAGTHRHASASVRVQMESLLARSAQVGALQVDLALGQIRAAGREIQQDIPTADLPALRSALLRLTRDDPHTAGALVYTPDGSCVLSVPPLSPASDAGAPPLPGPGAGISRSFPHPASGEPVVAVPIRAAAGKRLSYQLVLLVRESALSGALRSLATEGITAHLVDLGDVPGEPSRGPVDPRALAALGQHAAITPPTPLFRPLTAARRTREAPWAVVAAMPEERISRAARTAARHLLPWTIIGILAAAAAGVATAAWVTYPLRRLTASAERLAGGALTERTGIHRHDEIGHLAATFDSMAEELSRKWDENAELYSREQRRTQMLQALEEVAHAVNSTLSLDQVLDTILRRSHQFVGVYRCAITLIDDEGRLRVRCAAGLSDAFLARLEDPLAADPCAGQALAEGRTATAYASHIPPEEGAAWREEGIEAVACAPMMLSGRAIGGLHIYGAEQRQFGEEQIQALAALAAQAAIAAHNARLFEESQRKTRDVRISFRRIGAALASGLNLDDTLALIAELACDMLHADACLIRLLDRAGGELVSRASHGLAVSDVEPPRLATGQGLSGRVAYTGLPLAVEDLACDPRAVGFPEQAGIRAYLGVPLRVKSKVFGVLSVFKRSPYAFPQEEIELLSSFGAQASVALENRRLWEQERRIAHTLQRSLLPAIPPTLEGLELGELYSPSQRDLEVGGDFYDLFPLDHGRIGVVMGDVCGKGIQAAVYTAMAKYAIRSYALDDPSPVSVMRRTNRALCRQIVDDSMFISIVYALIDAHSMTLAVANAGHPHPLHYRQAAGTAVPIESEGTLAGLVPHARYGEAHVSLRPGDTILLYTDGIIEARRGREVWGPEALARSLERHASEPAADLVRAVAEDARGFAGGALHDDIAILAVKMP